MYTYNSPLSRAHMYTLEHKTYMTIIMLNNYVTINEKQNDGKSRSARGHEDRRIIHHVVVTNNYQVAIII